MKTVLVVTGTRADYGIYRPVLRAIKEASDLKLVLLATGMHLSPEYGYTCADIEADGFEVKHKIPSLLHGDTHGNMARSIAFVLLGITQVIEQEQPEVMLLLGDRGEMLAAAIAAMTLNVLVAHLHGGEVSGTIDESVRHSISKLAHIHFPATVQSAERLIKMGEDSWRVNVVGAPRLEEIRQVALPPFDDVAKRYHLNVEKPYLLFLYHPVTTKREIMIRLRSMLELLANQPCNLIIIGSNADAGNLEIQSLYKEIEQQYANIRIVNTFKAKDFLTVLRDAQVLIGNSSSGIIEAASFQIPVINIGSRQYRRERSGNVIDIEDEVSQLAKALVEIERPEFRKQLKEIENVYEKADTSAKIVEVLTNLTVSEKWIQKTITY